MGVVDADIYGHSVPRMLGVTGRPTQVEDMIMPPSAHDVKVISIGMFVADNAPVVWRGPMLHRALQQFLSDVFWGDLDVLLMDLPPGTGDIAISVAQLVPPAELLVVTTPQQAAAEVAERAGTIALQTHQQIAGVVENMSYLPCPHCGDRIDVFGSGGGQAVAEGLSRSVGAPVPLLGQMPIDTRLREGGDNGRAARARRPRRTGGQGAADRRRPARPPGPRPGRPVARLDPRRALTARCSRSRPGRRAAASPATYGRTRLAARSPGPRPRRRWARRRASSSMRVQQVLADHRARVQVAQREVTELRAQLAG